MNRFAQCLGVMVILFAVSVEAESEIRMEDLVAACDRGDFDRCAEAAWQVPADSNRYRQPDRQTHLTQVHEEAAALFRKARDGGSGSGCRGLGMFYASGNYGIPKDVAAAAKLYEKGCQAGNGGACLDLGYHYAEGLGVNKDDARAQALFREACELGHRQGMQIPKAHASPTFVAKSEVEAQLARRDAMFVRVCPEAVK